MTRKLAITRPSRLNPQILWLLVLLAAIALAFTQTGRWGEAWFNPQGWPLVWRFLRASVQPDLSPAILQVTLEASLTTLAYAVCGTVLSVILGTIGGVLSSEVWWLAIAPQRRRQVPALLWLGIRGLLAVPRAIHELVWGLLFVNLWGLDPLTAVLAIAIPFGAIVAKVFAEILDETPRQPLLALINSGVPPLSAFCYSLIPQASLNLLSYTFYRFECSLRSAAVLGVIGAGGLGYQIFLSLQSLRYEQLWTFFLALVILNGLVDFASAWCRDRLGCAHRLHLNAGSLTSSKRRQGQRMPLMSGLLGGVVLVAWSFWYIHPEFSHLWSPRTWVFLSQGLQSALPLTLEPGQAQTLLRLCLQTLAMSLLGIAIAATLGLLLAFPAARNFFLPGGLLRPHHPQGYRGIWPWLALLLARGALLVTRAIPAPIWALVLLFVLFPGMLPGAIALGLHNLGILGRLLAEGLENLEPAPLQALKAQGTPASLVFLYGVLPLTLPHFLAYSLYRWEVCLRETVIVGLVGAGGLGRLLMEQLSSFDNQGIALTLGCFIFLTFMVDAISTTARRSLR